MLRKMEKEAMAAILHGQESINALKMLTNESAHPTVDANLNNVLHSFSLLSFLFDSSKSKSKATQSLNKKSSRDEGEEEGCVFHTVDSPTSILDDGFLWRNYGQKTIKGSPYRRNYFRCANAKDQNCNAKKQVQQIQENPSVYRTVYNGPHLCQSSVFLYSTNNDTHSSTKVFRFDNPNQAITHSKLSLLVPVDPVEAVNQTRDEDFEDFLLNPEQFWLPEFSYLPGEDAMFS